MDEARLAFFALGALALVLAIGVEGASIVMVPAYPSDAAGLSDVPRPGLGIRYLGLVDGVLAYALLLIAGAGSHSKHFTAQRFDVPVVSHCRKHYAPIPEEFHGRLNTSAAR